MRIVWVTDIHLNFLRPEERAGFYSSIVDQGAEGVFVTGDIAEAPTLFPLLEEMSQAVGVPLYFVLGNHDFYFGTVSQVRQSLEQWCDEKPGMCYLSVSGVVKLTPTTVLIGQDGWGDGRLGNYARSPVRLSDQQLIRDFHGLDRENILSVLHAFGEQEGQRMRQVLQEGLDLSHEVICLTHVPPFKEACWYEGQVGNDDWLPFFTCKAVGDVFVDLAQQHPQKNITVYCGHTHHGGTVQILPNLRVITGVAEYGAPTISQVLEIA